MDKVLIRNQKKGENPNKTSDSNDGAMMGSSRNYPNLERGFFKGIFFFGGGAHSSRLKTSIREGYE